MGRWVDQSMLHVYMHENPHNKSHFFAQLTTFVLVFFFYKSLHIFQFDKEMNVYRENRLTFDEPLSKNGRPSNRKCIWWDGVEMCLRYPWN